MSLDIHIQMNEAALAPYQSALDRGIQQPPAQSPVQLAEQALAHHRRLRGAQVAPFLRAHVAAIPQLAELLSDTHWRLPESARKAFTAALAYFNDPADIIPDDASHFGLLDDAIVLELALAQHREEWRAWCEYAALRRALPEIAGINREEWLALDRSEVETALRYAQHRVGTTVPTYGTRRALPTFAVH